MSTDTHRLAPRGRNVAATIERRLALEILRGVRAPGTHLPPVRTLAGDLGVTVPTIQRVVDRLETTGLVTVRRGSGVVVNDPQTCGDLSLLPLWFEALADEPARAAAVLGDFLELRRVVTVYLIRRAHAQLLALAPILRVAAAALDPTATLDERVRQDLAVTRAVVTAADQRAVAALFHTSEELMRTVPLVAESLYGDGEDYVRVARAVVDALLQPGAAAEVGARVEAILAAWDGRSVARCARLLEQRGAGGDDAPAPRRRRR